VLDNIASMRFLTGNIELLIDVLIFQNLLC
jgi:hypothetical protein